MTLTVTKKDNTSQSYANVKNIDISESNNVVISFIQNPSSEKKLVATLTSSDFADLSIVIQARETPNEQSV